MYVSASTSAVHSRSEPSAKTSKSEAVPVVLSKLNRAPAAYANWDESDAVAPFVRSVLIAAPVMSATLNVASGDERVVAASPRVNGPAGMWLATCAARTTAMSAPTTADRAPFLYAASAASAKSCATTLPCAHESLSLSNAVSSNKTCPSVWGTSAMTSSSLVSSSSNASNALHAVEGSKFPERAVPVEGDARSVNHFGAR